MPVTHLRLLDVSFSFSDVALLDAVQLSFARGWTGVVGPNGSGKTTLLSLLSDRLRPSSGRLEALPRPGPVALCEQRVDEAGGDVAVFSAADDGEAHRLRGLLELEPSELARWPTLSPGERKRWQVGAALHGQPEVLLLDEPGNHLDSKGRALLLRALQTFRGVGVVVSHDRTLLDALTGATVRLEGGVARSWPLPYSKAREAWLAEEAALLAARAELDQKLASARRTLDEGRRRQQAAGRQRSAGRRMKDRHDSDARSVTENFRAERAERSLADANRRQLHGLEQLHTHRDALQVPREAPGPLFLRYRPCPRPVVVSLALDQLCAGERVLIDAPVRLSVRRDARLALLGDNGAGKSTLLTKLLAACSLERERVLHLPQELSAEEGARALAEVKALAPEARGRVLQLLDVLGVDPELLLRSASPSPGEARKLWLARGLASQSWLLLLDEPTHHLDLASVERLEAALADWPGALVMCSHDLAFVDALGAERVEVPHGFV